MLGVERAGGVPDAGVVGVARCVRRGDGLYEETGR